MVEYSLTSLGEIFLEPIATLYINSASIVGRKIESTVNTQLSFSFSTRPLTVNNNSGATGIDITSGVRYILLT
jgi:hypothetical protein